MVDERSKFAVLWATLFLVVLPVTAVAFICVAFVNRPLSKQGRYRSSYAKMGMLAVTSGLIGGLSISAQEHVSGRARAAMSLQAVLGFLVGVSVMDLGKPASQDAFSRLCGRRAGLLHTITVSVVLFCATLLTLITPLLPARALQAASILRFLPPALFLAFTLLSLPRVIFQQITSSSSNTRGAHTTITFPEIQSRGASPAFNANFGFDPGAQHQSAALRTFRFPPLPEHDVMEMNVTSSFRAFMPSRHTSQQQQTTRLTPIPATPSNASATSTSTSHSRQNNNSVTGSRSTGWMESLNSLRAQVSIGALRAREVMAGTNCRPITIHVATQRSSFTHAREPCDGPEAGVAVGIPEIGRRVVHGWRRDGGGDMPSEEPNTIRIPVEDSDSMRYPPRSMVQGHHPNLSPCELDRRHVSTTSRASEASTSEGHGQSLGAKVAGKELGYPSALRPTGPDVEQQYRQSTHCVLQDQWDAKHNDIDLAQEHDIGVESTDGGCNFSKHGSLSGSQAHAKFTSRIDIDAGTGYAAQRVTHVALPAIRSAVNLGSRFSVGEDLASVDSRRNSIARRGSGICLLGAQIASAAGWGWALGAAFATGQSSSSLYIVEILRTGQAACMMLATVGTIMAYFLHRDSYDHEAASTPARSVYGTKANRSGRKARSGGTTPTFGHATPPAFDTPNSFAVSAAMFADTGPFSSNNGAAAVVSERTVTNTALYAALPSSSVNHGYVQNKANDSGNRAERRCGPSVPATGSDRAPYHSDRVEAKREEPAGYTPPPSSFPQTLSIPRGRKAYSAVQISPPPPRIDRRRRGVDAKGNSRVLGNARGDSMEWADKNAIGSTGDDTGEVLEAIYSDNLGVETQDNMDAEKDRGAKRALLSKSSTTVQRTRQHHISADYRKSLAGSQSPVYGSVNIGINGGTRHRKHVTDDPSTYIRKRGSVPPPVAGRKLLGWDWGWEGSKKGKDGSGVDVQGQETSFIDLHSRAGQGRAKEGPKGKRQSLLSGIVSLASSVTRDGEDAPVLGRSPSIVRKLRKASKPQAIVELTTLRMPASPTSPPASPDSPATLTGYFGRLGHRTPRTTSSGGQATNDEGPQPEDAAPHIVQLKRSFRLGVGRTMGPSLTLAVAEQAVEEEMTPAMRERQRYYNSQRQKEEAAAREKRQVEVEEDRDSSGPGEGSVAEVDESTTDGEIQSIAAAKLVSASIARATPAATILTAPSTPVKVGFRTSYSSTYTAAASPKDTLVNGHLRPGLGNLAIDGRAPSPQSPLSPNSSGGRTPVPGGVNWKPHPFADAVEEIVTSTYPIEPVKEGVQRELTARRNENDLVQLELEMEERNRQADNAKTKLDLDLKGRAQERQTMSTPPVTKSDWTPKVSTAAPPNANFSNLFPIIFGASTSPSPRSASPSVAPTHSYQQSVSSSTPGTPRSGTNIRLPSKTMDTVRTVFAGVSARMSSATSRMSVTSAVARTPRGAHRQAPYTEVLSAADDVDRDFMDLRDPFAPPPPATTTVPLTLSPVSTRPWDNFLVIDSYGVDDAVGGGEKGMRTRRRRMSAWGRLPLAARTLSPAPSSAGASITTMITGKRAVVNKAAHRASRVKAGTRKTKKERRTRKVTLSGTAAMQSSIKAASDGRSDDEYDNDFGLDEALLSQRLLRRLNSTEWEVEWDGKA